MEKLLGAFLQLSVAKAFGNSQNAKLITHLHLKVCVELHIHP
jgi:hypothetical protein